MEPDCRCTSAANRWRSPEPEQLAGLLRGGDLPAPRAAALRRLGLFGVLSYVVGERTHELGIRIALGARPRAVILDVARRALPAVLGGLVVGVLGSALVGGALRVLLFESRGFELTVLLLVVAAMLVTAILALLVPARRAASVDPSVSLRAE